MSGCTSSPAIRGTGTCPNCHHHARRVSVTTIAHHLKAPWQWREDEQNYYFCESADCDTVYFSETGWRRDRKDVRTEIGIKTPSNKNTLICYCYGVSHAMATGNPDIKAYVIEKTKTHSCACETRNPSGRCCLKDFP